MSPGIEIAVQAATIRSSSSGGLELQVGSGVVVRSMVVEDADGQWVLSRSP